MPIVQNTIKTTNTSTNPTQPDYKQTHTKCPNCETPNLINVKGSTKCICSNCGLKDGCCF